MEMDIPLPDELEWLEAKSNFDDDLLHPNPYPPDDDDDEPPPLPATNGHKRPRSSAGSDSPICLEEELPAVSRSDEKRTKLDSPPPRDPDDDWLSYSPPREPDAVHSTVEPAPEEEEVEERIISRYASEIDGDFVPVTAPSGGDRVYAKIYRFEGNEAVSIKSRLVSQINGGGLLGESIGVLLSRLEQEALSKALRASSEVEVQSDSVVPVTNVAPSRLWVDKYAPSSFTDLLSDEQTNREVLLWLKQWDSTVFGSEIRNTADEVFSALRRHSSVAKQHKPSESTVMMKNRGQRWRNGSFSQSNEIDNQNSNFKGGQEMQKKPKLAGPPEHKILLLCGPPGLGKTTLAHVAAKHCGYRVVEVNASDDRSTSVIEAKILDVVQMNSVTADARPKCLVIDEIDGALSDGKGAVEVILKMLKSDNRKGKTELTENSGKISSKKAHKVASLLRPVICICNDLYAPALRPLRQVAKVHVFVQPTVTRVVNRLKYICCEEGMKVNSIALTVLAAYTECDIRSCLNTLQFLNKKKEALNVLDIGAQVVGQKDVSRSAFDVWKEIFQKRKLKPNRKSDNRKNMSAISDSIFSLVSNRGDYDIILDGIHENILQLQYHDPVMQKTVKCFNALGTSDLMHQYTLRNQQMSLLAYQPLLASRIHHLVAQIQKPHIEWPKSYQRCITTQMERMEVLRTWQNQMPPCISRHLSCKASVEDLITPLLHVLSPSTLRPVALHSLSEKYKSDFAQLVNIMISYCVTYKYIKTDHLSSREQETALETSLTLVFDPPVHEFIGFKDHVSSHYVLPLAMKQVLVHEVEKRRILLVSKSTDLTRGVNKENEIIQPGQNCNARSSAAPLTTDSSRTATPNVKPTGNTRKPSRTSASFFDRFRKASVKVGDGSENAVEKTSPLQARDSRPLLFKYNEGFTNAIKRPVRMRDFLS